MMTREQIQTVLEALSAATCYPEAGCEDKRYEESIAILQAALARVDKPLEPSEPHAWEYTNVQSGFKQMQSYPPEHFEEFNDMEMWHVKPLFTHPAPSKPMEPDKDLIQALTERDEYHDMADKLAEGIALHFDGDIGEHSSSNSPWDRALDLLDSAACAETMRFTHPASKPEPSEVVYIRRDQLQKARRQAFLCEVGPEPREDKVAVFTHPAPRLEPKPYCCYCESDNEGIRSTYFDQTCEGCVKRMTHPAKPEPSEPVAEVAGDYNTKHIIFLPAGIALEVGDKLFTHPAPSKPSLADIRGAVARGWCTERNAYKTMDVDLAEDIADAVWEKCRG